jgi:hypothetical protein
MAIRIVPHSREFTPAVKAFNARLSAAEIADAFTIDENPAPPSFLEKRQEVWRKIYLVIDEEHVRGSYLLQGQPYYVGGLLREVVDYQSPLSEGLFDRRYVHVGMLMAKQAMRDHPLLYTVGMGGFDRPLPKILKALGWQIRKVPFFFRVHHCRRFLREIRFLRVNPWRRIAAEVAALSGAGAILIKGWQTLRSRRGRGSPVKAEALGDWPDWVDQIWQRAHGRYSMVCLRNQASLNELYPVGRKSYLRFGLEDDRGPIGWVVLKDKTMQENRHLGNLRVGTVLDCLASPGCEGAVVRGATRLLQDVGADLFVSNQTDPSWVQAFGRAGWFEGPSNFLLGTSKTLSELVEANDGQNHIHVTRGDGDGQVNV